MKTYRFDVIIVGAGPAGVTAAGALAGSGLTVALIEAGVYAGAENWSGCVYFAESLATDEVFGIRAVENAPFERRVVRRGTFVHNGIDEVGVSLSDSRAFENCYTVLRPVYDPYFADLAQSKGATLITNTTVLSLIRKDGRVVGVQTERGPLHAGVVFIAEGDASHLVRSERLERVAAPHFLQGVKAVLSLPAGEIDARFQLGRSEGAAYEILVRNPAISGRTSRLNIGGFLYTNRDSLSLGYVMPLDNLRDQYRGGHDLLFEWLRSLPTVKDLTQGAALSAYGTKIIRSGGWRERPVLVEDGLAVGGASAGLGIDLPFPNFTGPASATGLYFARSVKILLKQGKPLTARNLADAYLAPLQESVYGRNAHYLSRWPKYFSTSRSLFGGTADLLCGTARFVESRSIIETSRFLRGQLFSPRAMKDAVSDTVRLITSLGLGRHLLLSLVHPATIGGPEPVQEKGRQGPADHDHREPGRQACRCSGAPLACGPYRAKDIAQPDTRPLRGLRQRRQTIREETAPGTPHDGPLLQSGRHRGPAAVWLCARSIGCGDRCLGRLPLLCPANAGHPASCRTGHGIPGGAQEGARPRQREAGRQPRIQARHEHLPRRRCAAH
jgi:electron transfer flavoprotein-quinone oxidoreductase